MPFLKLVENSNVLNFLFNFVLISAILTSLTSFLYATKSNFVYKFKSNFLNDLMCIFLVLIIALLGFSNIIENLYIIVGCIGISIIVFMFLSFKFCFYSTNNKIHKSSKYAKYDYTGHN